MQDPNIILTGYNSHSKCQVGNILLQGDAFKPFSCRRLVVKIQKNVTVRGMVVRVVLTPAIGTPMWMRDIETIRQNRRYNKRTFLFVYDPSVNIDIEQTVRSIQECFSGEQRILVVIHRHNTGKASMEDLLTRMEKQKLVVIPFSSPSPFSPSAREFTNQVFEKAGLLIRHTHAQRFPFATGEYIGQKGVQHKKPLESIPQIESISLPRSTDTNIGSAPSWLEVKVSVQKRHVGAYHKVMADKQAISYHTRVNVVGFQASGKTTLVSRLQENEITCPLRNMPPTECLDIDNTSCRCVEVDDQIHWETDSEGYVEDMNIQRLAIPITDLLEDYKEIVGGEEHMPILLSKQKSASSFSFKRKSEDNKYSKENRQNDSEFVMGSDFVGETISADMNWAMYRRNIHTAELLAKIVRRVELDPRERRYVTYWDFAGQTTYYTTHQAFLSPQAVYLLVVDLSKPLDMEIEDSLEFRRFTYHKTTIVDAVKFWSGSIKAYAADERGLLAPIIVVGTFRDKMQNEEEEATRDVFVKDSPTKVKNTITEDSTSKCKVALWRNLTVSDLIQTGEYIEITHIVMNLYRNEMSLSSSKTQIKDVNKIFAQIREIVGEQNLPCIAIDNTLPCKDDDYLKDLRNRILDMAMGIMEQKVSVRWFRLEYCLIIERAQESIIAFKRLEEINASCDFPLPKEELVLFLEYEHRQGLLMYFNSEGLNDVIILQPDLLVRFINILLRKRPPGMQTPQLTGFYAGWNCDGVFDKRYMDDASSHDKKLEKYKDELLKLLIHLKVIYPVEISRYIMPSLLQERPAGAAFAVSGQNSPIIRISFGGKLVPPVFFHNLMVALLFKLKPDFEIDANGNVKSQLFYHYCRFRLDEAGNFVLEMNWSESLIYLQFKLVSQVILLKDQKCHEYIDFICQTMKEILQIYKHDYIFYTVGIRCPEHDDYVSYFDLLRTKNAEARCLGGIQKIAHTVTMETMLDPWLNAIEILYTRTNLGNRYSTDQLPVKVLAMELTDRQIARLSPIVGEAYYQVFLMLGLDIPSIQRSVIDYKHTIAIVPDLFGKWRNKYAPNATVKDFLKLSEKCIIDMSRVIEVFKSEN